MDISASHADATRNNASFVGSKRKLAGDNEIEDSSSDDFIDAHVRHRQRPTVDQWLAPQRRSHEPFCDQGRDAEFNGAPPVSDDANSTSSHSNERAERRKPDWAQGSANASDSNFGADQKPRDVSLSDEQKVVLDHIMSGKSVFITGCGGTGKSFLMKQAIKVLQEKFGPAGVAVTATTGIAACHIGGTTLHSFAGIGIGQGPIEMLKQKLSRVAKERWQRTAVIIVDEISMLDADMFEKLDDVARYVRRSELPFGGVQLVLVGDFLQLPPVSKGQETCFCFESRVWGKTITMHVELKKVFRQANQEFVDMLNEIRWGRCSQKIAQILQRTSMNNLEKSDVKALQLFPKNREVDSINETALKEIKEEATVFEARDTGDYPFIDQLQKNCLAPSRLELKVGCQVMLLKNLDASRGLINGARGVVKEFQYHDDPEAKNSVVISPYVEFETSSHGVQGKIMVEEDFNIEIAGKLMACRTQLPLRLAYAITIHKCQGMTLNKVVMSLGEVFECGQAYVALSRVSAMEGLKLKGFNPKCVKAHPRVIEFYGNMDAYVRAKQLAFEQQPQCAARAPTSYRPVGNDGWNARGSAHQRSISHAQNRAPVPVQHRAGGSHGSGWQQKPERNALAPRSNEPAALQPGGRANPLLLD